MLNTASSYDADRAAPQPASSVNAIGWCSTCAMPAVRRAPCLYPIPGNVTTRTRRRGARRSTVRQTTRRRLTSDPQPGAERATPGQDVSISVPTHAATVRTFGRPRVRYRAIVKSPGDQLALEIVDLAVKARNSGAVVIESLLIGRNLDTCNHPTPDTGHRPFRRAVCPSGCLDTSVRGCPDTVVRLMLPGLRPAQHA